jgi:hypothetical protein
MGILRSEKERNAESPDRGRRSFFLKLAAGVSTALASTAGLAKAGSGNAEDLSLKVALLEEEKALRKLHRAYENALDKERYDEVIAMFTDGAEVVFNGEVFSNRSQGLSRLYRERFASGKTGKRMEPAPGFELDAEQQQERMEVSSDRLSAQAVFPYSIQVGVPIESETSLASMARLHGPRSPPRGRARGPPPSAAASSRSAPSHRGSPSRAG